MGSSITAERKDPWTMPDIPQLWHEEPIPGMTPEGEIACALRVLHSLGYDDYYHGHISVWQPDRTILTNPWEVVWDRVRASDILRIDDRGRKLSGKYSPSPGLRLHFLVEHYAPADLKPKIILHQHPFYATMWATLKRIPPIYEQGGTWHVPEIHLVPDFPLYEPDVITPEHGEAIARAGWALLGDHGVLLAQPTMHDTVHAGAVLEWRCRVAWEMEGRTDAKPMDREHARNSGRRIANHPQIKQWWSAMLHRQVDLDPAVLS
jgi:L-fuculose-phosphate aldolase